jgi:hypothetical protein
MRFSPPSAASSTVSLPPAEVYQRGVRFRNIDARAALELPGADELVRRSVSAGWEMRVLPELPMKMVLVDERAALLPLDPTGTEAALLLRAPVIVAMLRSYFEMLWARAVPLGQPGSRGRLTGCSAGTGGSEQPVPARGSPA